MIPNIMADRAIANAMHILPESLETGNLTMVCKLIRKGTMELLYRIFDRKDLAFDQALSGEDLRNRLRVHGFTIPPKASEMLIKVVDTWPEPNAPEYPTNTVAPSDIFAALEAFSLLAEYAAVYRW